VFEFQFELFNSVGKSPPLSIAKAGGL